MSEVNSKKDTDVYRTDFELSGEGEGTSQECILMLILFM